MVGVPVLTTEQIRKISVFRRRIMQTGLNEGREAWEFQGEYALEIWSIWPSGGGLVHERAQVDPTAYVGVGSLISEGSQIGRAAAVLNSTCYDLSYDTSNPVCILQQGALVKE